MSTSDADELEKAPPPADDGSIRASVERLVASGRELAEAEFAWAKLRAAILADGLRKSLVFGTLAIIFLVMGVSILVVSAIIALQPYVGWLAASLIVAAVSIVAAVLCALASRRTFAALFEDDPK